MALAGAVSCTGDRPSSESSGAPVRATSSAPKVEAPEQAVSSVMPGQATVPGQEQAPGAVPGQPGSGGEAGVQASGQTAGQDFIEEARMLYRVVACAGTAPIPPHLDAKVVESHCKALQPRMTEYRQRYGKDAREFIAKLRPSGLPQVVVYPFGGGDLISALVAFPDAVEITTISLEHAGDPRRIRELGAQDLVDSLAALSVEIGGMLEVSNNTSKNMSEAHKNLLPAQLSSFLIGLAVHGYEPTSVRYFTLDESGDVRYLGQADIAERDSKSARQLKHDWAQPNFSPAFSNVEVQFRPQGTGPDEPVRIHRHIAANLADTHLDKNPGLLKHLEAKGKVSAMTKAASYLLWRPMFSRIRDYLLQSMAWMISDSTGIPPFYARKAGMKQTTYGLFAGSFLTGVEQHNEDFRKLWKSQPYRPVRFRFGYVDSEKHAHLLVTEPAAR